MLVKVLIGWLLLAIALAAFLCRQIHKAKMADRAMRLQRPQPLRRQRSTDAAGQRKDDSDRNVA